MILPDVNVVIYAFRKDSQDHKLYHDWLESVVNGDSVFGMSTQVLASFIRICTHPRIFVHPSKLEETLRFSDIFLDRPNCRLIQPGERHWSIFSKLLQQARATGNLVPDAWFAALAIESGCEWITTDGDYSRFKGLITRAPF